jgi:hypothetical protein
VRIFGALDHAVTRRDFVSGRNAVAHGLILTWLF